MECAIWGNPNPSSKALGIHIWHRAFTLQASACFLMATKNINTFRPCPFLILHPSAIISFQTGFRGLKGNLTLLQPWNCDLMGPPDSQRSGCTRPGLWALSKGQGHLSTGPFQEAEMMERREGLLCRGPGTAGSVSES